MADLERPPEINSPRLWDWLNRLWLAVKNLQSGETAATGSTTDHAALSNLNSSNFTHLTSAAASALTSNGDTTLHFHNSDRNRANHTGTQTADTIVDFAAAVQAVALTNANGVLEAQVFGP